MGKDNSTPPPDPRLVEAQIRSMGYQDDAIQRMMANMEQFAPLQEAQMRQAIDAQNLAMEQSQADRTWMLGRRSALAGMQDRLISDANSFNTEDRREQLAAEARGDVASAFGAQRGMMERQALSMGINPSDGRFSAMQHQMGHQEALATATAANKVRAVARQEGMALTDRAVNALAGYPAMSMQATGAAAGYGLSGLNAANAGVQGMNSGWGAVGQSAGAMGSGAMNAWGTQSSAYQNAQNSNAQATGAVVGAVGTIGAAYLGRRNASA